jgi:hypothetical protein
MNAIDRRKLLALASCGLAAATVPEQHVAAQPGFGPAGLPNVQGEWVNLTNNRPCGIFQAGSILMMVNENGSIATAHVQGNRFSLMQGWNAANLSGLITNNVIRFSNGSEWRRV